MLKHVLFSIAAACGLMGCADVAGPAKTIPDQSQTAGAPCTVEAPSTGSLVRRKTCG
jgi:hypothetical protein